MYKPPYEINEAIIQQIASISEKLGEVNASFLDKPQAILRKQNAVKTIHASLKIEGNTLTEDQITALLNNKRILGPKKDIIEALNALKVYENLQKYEPHSEKDFLKAHKALMNDLIEIPGSYRTQSVGIMKGSKLEHIAPPNQNVPYLMKDLFRYLKSSKELDLIKSCVFHYEMEFIHPFIDGNGRMGRLWQTLILMKKHPVFEYLPFESLIAEDPKAYYKALSRADKEGASTGFIEYMLELIEHSLREILNNHPRSMGELERLQYFIEKGIDSFQRSDYMRVFKTISSATASRDLKKGISLNLFEKTGERNKTRYQVIKK
jgi:Fic family protein